MAGNIGKDDWRNFYADSLGKPGGTEERLKAWLWGRVVEADITRHAAQIMQALSDLRLVVIDPEAAGDRRRLGDALAAQLGRFFDDDCDDASLTAALRSLVADPKPDEPQGLGAVVEDAEGRRWIRVDWTNPWCIAKPNRREPHQQGKGMGSVSHDSHVRWPSVNAVRVLSEGWTE